MSQNKISVYACGGTAINIMSPLVDLSKSHNSGYAELKLTMIDTSKSNLAPNMDYDFFHVTGFGDVTADGSGMVRSANFKAAKQVAPKILHEHPPSNLNVVVCSGGGGSGSTIANVLADELLSKHLSTIVIMVGATNCSKSISNTIETLQSFHGISQSRGQSLSINYLENKKGMPIDKEVDIRARAMLLLIASVWSGENHGLDSADLSNFLKPDSVTQFPVGINALISSMEGHLELDRGQAISTLVSAMRHAGEDASVDQIVPYHVFGILSEAAIAKVQVATPIHLATVQGYFSQVLDRLKKQLATSEDFYRLNPIGNALDAGSSQEGGFVIT